MKQCVNFCVLRTCDPQVGFDFQNLFVSRFDLSHYYYYLFIFDNAAQSLQQGHRDTSKDYIVRGGPVSTLRCDENCENYALATKRNDCNFEKQVGQTSGYSGNVETKMDTLWQEGGSRRYLIEIDSNVVTYVQRTCCTYAFH